MAVKIQGGSNTAGQANVSADYELAVKPTVVADNAGLVGVVAESSPSTGPIGRLVRALEATSDYRLRVVAEQCLLMNSFSGTAQCHNLYVNNNGMTVSYNALSDGGMKLNPGNITTDTSYAIAQSTRQFNIPLEGGLYFAAKIRWSDIQVNTTWSCGLRSDHVSVAPGANPVSGVFLRRNDAGTLQFVTRHNDTDVEATTITETDIATGIFHHIVIGVSHVSSECWINGELVAKHDHYNTTGGRAWATIPGLSPAINLRNYGVPSSAVQFWITEWSVWDAAQTMQRTPPQVAASSGMVLPNNALAQGSPSVWTNSGAATALTLSNTTATVSTAAGGNVTFAATASGNTDYIVACYQPDLYGNTSNYARTFYITGVQVSAVNTGAANSGTVPTTLLFGVAIGGSSVTLAGTDTVAARAPRRAGIGMLSIPISAVVGQIADRNLYLDFSTPLPVDPSQYMHLVMRIVSGAATASQVIQLNYQFFGYWD